MAASIDFLASFFFVLSFYHITTPPTPQRRDSWFIVFICVGNRVMNKVESALYRSEGKLKKKAILINRAELNGAITCVYYTSRANII
jgi:hypothetical protein